jgi:hypothetical protein
MVFTSANHVNLLKRLKRMQRRLGSPFGLQQSLFSFGRRGSNWIFVCVTDCAMDLTARLEYLLRVYAAAFGQVKADAERLREQFRRDLEPLVEQYGQEAVIAALDRLPDRPCPSVSLH